MAVDLFCYTSLTQNLVEERLVKLVAEHQEVFRESFLMSSARQANTIHKEIALEHGLVVANSFFLVSLNDKNAASLVLTVSSLIKEVFAAGNVIVLHNNEISL